ncbi:asparaginase [Blastomyces dermatitidis ER-3]|uniref:Asparaginase n=1 Tax=Ajellomyces dermatitidis (strain ER-3 / ATCC MYA-2586) TaxID=559297 RepID=A0ABP2EW58_AJEDR|nr:asparaginase [Blastomyces dermatitidis ER-3]EEQ88264.1 asparaginase [Blastomyces dermatitidis ER-3]
MSPPIPQPRQRTRSQPLFKPAVILHGGAGNIQHSRLPPELYKQYRTSLLTYLRSTTALLNADIEEEEPSINAKNDAVDDNMRISPASALNAAVHAVSLMEDNELFNCGRGSVFTSAGTIEMEASVMVASLLNDEDSVDDFNNSEVNCLASEKTPGSIKRGAGVMLVRNVRHPIQLAKEVLLRTGYANDGDGDGGNMHSQLSGEYVEGLARDWGMEFCPDDWFWTKKRWDEHRRGLKKGKTRGRMTDGRNMGADVEVRGEGEADDGDGLYLSQGTVGCVCLDRWGNIAVATSTGGLTNKCPGRIGDTPTLGAGFWAEAWDVEGVEGLSNMSDSSNSVCASGRDRSKGCIQLKRDTMNYQTQDGRDNLLAYQASSSTTTTTSSYRMGSQWRSDFDSNSAFTLIRDCFSSSPPPPGYAALEPSKYPVEKFPLGKSTSSPHTDSNPHRYSQPQRRRILALSGTGNGDSFLRTAATRTAAAMVRFGSAQNSISLAQAVTAVAGPGGELQRSAGRRWGKTGEGEGGIIGIEAEVETDEQTLGEGKLRRGKVVFDFNSTGMFRAWMEEKDGKDVERMMVFRDDYE